MTEERKAPFRCPLCGGELEDGIVSLWKTGDYDATIRYYPAKENRRGERVPDRDRARPLRNAYAAGFAALNPERYYSQAGCCAACGKIVLLLDTVSGPKKDP